MSERSYFLAHGESEKKVRDFFARRLDALREASELAKSLGGDGTVGSRRVSGVIFKGGKPEGWAEKGVTSTGERYYMPLRKSKAGKALAARISSLRIPDGMELHSEFSNDGGHLATSGMGISIQYISAEIAKGKAIISVPAGMDFTPPESTPLKMSEYWALKE